MPIEQPSNTDNLPKLVIAEEGVEYILNFEDQNIKKHRDGGPAKGTSEHSSWGCYRIKGLVVVRADEDEEEIEEGTNEIPFWAMEQFFDAYTQLDKKQLKKEISFTYVRVRNGKTGKNEASIEVDE